MGEVRRGQTKKRGRGNEFISGSAMTIAFLEIEAVPAARSESLRFVDAEAPIISHFWGARLPGCLRAQPVFASHFHRNHIHMS